MEKDIKKRIEINFQKRASRAIKLLTKFESKNEELSPRISRCIVHLAQGNIKELKKTIKLAETDWRDVIDAESVDFEFNEPFDNA